MKIKSVRKIGMVCMAFIFACMVLIGCAPSLKETTVQGIDSAISVKLPGDLKKDDTKMPLDPTMKQYVKGQQLYRVDDSSLSVVIFTMSVDTQAFVGLSGQDLNVSMEGPTNSYVKAVLSSLKAKDVKQTKENLEIGGKQVAARTITFTSEDKKMAIKVVAFQNKDAYWMIIPVYQTGDQDVEKAANDLVKSITVK
jgi:hypothetical protein